MSKIGYTQDMPPPGGYANVNYKQQVPKKAMGFYSKFGIFMAVTGYGWYMWHHYYKIWRMRRIEMMDARYAVKPIILAEQHRHTMRHWRKNRDYENDLMKDVPNWKTGTFFGEPVYYNVRDRYLEPSVSEYFSHNSLLTQYNHLNEKLEH